MVPVYTYNKLAKEPIIVEKIYTHRGDRTELKIDYKKLDLEAIKKLLRWKATPGFEWTEKLLVPVLVRRAAYNPENNVLVTVKFKQPVEFCDILDKDHIYRLVSFNPVLAVRDDGEVFYLGTGEKLKQIAGYDPSTYMKYKRIYFKGETYTHHRLVAWVWVDNEDYIKNYIVDHIDENKINNHPKNLRWVSNMINTVRSHITNTGKSDFRYLVFDIEKNKEFKYPSLKEIEKDYGIDYRVLEWHKNTSRVLTPKGWIVIADVLNFDKEKYEKEIELARHQGKRYKLISGDDIKYVDTIKEACSLVGITVGKLNNPRLKKMFNSRQMDIFNYLMKTMGKNYKLEFIGDEKDKSYQLANEKYKIEAKNLETGEIIVEESTRKMGERLGVNKSHIIFRLNGNIREGLPLTTKDGTKWLIRKSTHPWPEIREPKKSEGYKIKHMPTGRIFNSLREASRELGISRILIRKELETGKRFKKIH